MAQPRQRRHVRENRPNRGNMLVAIAAALLALLVAVIVFFFDFTRFSGSSHEHLAAAEAATLTAAQDLARIVIRDKNYGYIALAEFPPIGQKTVAPDGRPVPVTSINTILATARLDAIIADSIGNEDLRALAAADVKNAKSAAKLLNDCLAEAIKANESSTVVTDIAGDKGDPLAGPFTDMDGNVVTPLARAKQVYLSNSVNQSNGGAPIIKDFQLDLGWIDNGTSTVTPLPQPLELSQVPDSARSGKYYKGFVDVPVGGVDFYLAGLASQPALVDGRHFQLADGLRVCSAVRVNASYTYNKSADKSTAVLKSTACAIPTCGPDTPPAGVMAIAFPDGYAPGVNQMADLLNNPDLKSSRGNVGESRGDFPYDPGSSLQPGSILTAGGPTGTPSPSQMFAHAFYAFLKSAHARPNIKSTTDAMGTAFSSITIGDTTITSLPKHEEHWLFDLTQPAYAQAAVAPASTITAALAANPIDRWSLMTTSPPPATALAAYNAVANFQSVQSELPDNATMLALSRGNLQSTDGNVISQQDLTDFWRMLKDTNTAALQTLAIANSLGSSVSATNARTNATKVSDTVAYIAAHLTCFTADGLKKNPDGTWIVGGIKLTPHPLAAVDGAAILSGASPSGAPTNLPWGTSPNLFADVFFDYKNYYVNNAPGTDLAANAPTINNRSNWPLGPYSSNKPNFNAYGMNPWIYLTLEYDADGLLVMSDKKTSPFAALPVSDRQNFAVCTKAMNTAGVVWTATMRNESGKLGQGKHAGQPLAGSPVNWAELGYFSGSTAIARSKAKGTGVMGLDVANFGGIVGPNGNNNDDGSAGGSKHVGLASNGLGPRSGQPGNGDWAHDYKGFPWGFKSIGNPGGATWTESDVRYQFPRGGDELANVDDICFGNTGKAFAYLTKRLNNTGYEFGWNIYPVNMVEDNITGGRIGEKATFSAKSGAALTNQPRANYLEGGLVSEFQLRAPVYITSDTSKTTGITMNSPGNGTARLADGSTMPLGIQAPIATIAQPGNAPGIVGTTDMAPYPLVPKMPDGLL